MPTKSRFHRSLLLGKENQIQKTLLCLMSQRRKAEREMHHLMYHISTQLIEEMKVSLLTTL